MATARVSRAENQNRGITHDSREHEGKQRAFIDLVTPWPGDLFPVIYEPTRFHREYHGMFFVLMMFSVRVAPPFYT